MRNRRSEFWQDAAIMALALAIRLLHGLAVRGEPMFGFPLVDEGLYWREAVRIASGAAPDPVFYWPPLFSHVLAALVRLFGPSAAAARMFLLVFSAIAAPLTVRLARPVVGNGAALLAGAFVALYAPAVFYGAELLPASTILLINLFAPVGPARGGENRAIRSVRPRGTSHRDFGARLAGDPALRPVSRRAPAPLATRDARLRRRNPPGDSAGVPPQRSRR